MAPWWFVVASQLGLNWLSHRICDTQKQRRIWGVVASLIFPLAFTTWTLGPILTDVMLTDNVSIGIVEGELWLLKLMAIVGIQLAINYTVAKYSNKVAE